MVVSSVVHYVFQGPVEILNAFYNIYIYIFSARLVPAQRLSALFLLRKFCFVGRVTGSLIGMTLFFQYILLSLFA